MQDDVKVDNVPPVENNVQTPEPKEVTVDDGKQSVQYETYKRVLSKLKNNEAETESLKEKLSIIEREKLEAEGNKDKLIESLKEDLREKDNKLKTTVGSIARSQAMSAIVDEAVKAGCNSPEVVKRFLEDDIEKLNFDSDFNPDRDQVKGLIENAKQQAPVLFSKKAPDIANHNHINKGPTVQVQSNLKKMPMDKLMEAWAEAETK